jgi:hypothetical protein
MEPNEDECNTEFRLIKDTDARRSVPTGVGVGVGGSRLRWGSLRALRAAAQVGASVFAGVLMMVVLIPINTKISKIQSGLNREIMKMKDQARTQPARTSHTARTPGLSRLPERFCLPSSDPLPCPPRIALEFPIPPFPTIHLANTHTPSPQDPAPAATGLM